jgi:hypothetical protein
MGNASRHDGHNGHSLLELLVALSIMLALLALVAPQVRAFAVQARILGVARIFKGEFLRARSTAVRSGVQTAIRFERDGRGDWRYSLYADGNHNGVLSADIRSGVDARLAGPFALETPQSVVRVGILPGAPAIPPDTGSLDPADPIRFGRSDMLSFSPQGTATPGTFYLMGERTQAAVRVNGMTARVRLLVLRGNRWQEEP